MAVGFSLRSLSISCLLIGSITCYPANKYNLASAYSDYMRQPWLPRSVHHHAGSHVPHEHHSSGSPPSWAESTSSGLENAGSISEFPSSATVDFGSVNYQGSIDSPPSEVYQPISQASFDSYQGKGASDSFEGHGASDYYQGHGASDYFQGKGASNTEQTQDSGSPDGVYSSYDDVGYYSNVGTQDEGYDDSKGSVDVGQHVGYDGGYEQDTGTPAGIHVESDTSEEAPEEVFSDVSDLQPVYSYSSRSRYQQGKTAFSQTRYTPWEYQLPSPSNPAVWEPVEDSSKGGL